MLFKVFLCQDRDSLLVEEELYRQSNNAQYNSGCDNYEYSANVFN